MTATATTTNLAKLQDHLSTQEVPAVLVTDITNVRWLTGFGGSFGMVIVTPEAGLFLTDSRYRIQAVEQVQQVLGVSERRNLGSAKHCLVIGQP